MPEDLKANQAKRIRLDNQLWDKLLPITKFETYFCLKDVRSANLKIQSSKKHGSHT